MLRHLLTPLLQLVARWSGGRVQCVRIEELEQTADHQQSVIDNLRHEADLARLEHDLALREITVLRQEVDFLAAVNARQRLQVEAEQAVTARQIAEGKIP